MAGFDIVDLIFRVKDESAAGIKKVNKSIKGGIGKLKSLQAAVAGIAIGVAVTQIKKAVEEVDELAKTASRIDFDVENLQEISFVAQQAGINFREFALGLQRFERRLAEVAATGSGEFTKALEIFKSEGIEFDIKLNTNIDETRTQRFQRFLEAVNQLDDGGKRLLVSFKAFDSEGAKIGVLLAQTAKDFEEARKQAREFGVVLDKALVARAEDFNNQLALAGVSLKRNLQRGLIDAAPAIISATFQLADLARTVTGLLGPFERFEILSAAALSLQPLDDAAARLQELIEKRLFLLELQQRSDRQALTGGLLGQLFAPDVGGRIDVLDADIQNLRDNLAHTTLNATKLKNEANAIGKADALAGGISIFAQLEQDISALNAEIRGTSNSAALRLKAKVDHEKRLAKIDALSLSDQSIVNDLKDKEAIRFGIQQRLITKDAAEDVREIQFRAGLSLLGDLERAHAEENEAIRLRYIEEGSIVESAGGDITGLIEAETADRLRAQKKYNDDSAALADEQATLAKESAREIRGIQFRAQAALLGELEQQRETALEAIRIRYDDERAIIEKSNGDVTELIQAEAAERLSVQEQYNEDSLALAKKQTDSVRPFLIAAQNAGLSDAQAGYNRELAALKERYREGAELVKEGLLDAATHQRAYFSELEELGERHRKSANAFAFDLEETVGQAFVSLGDRATDTITGLILGQQSLGDAARQLGAEILASMVRIPVEGFIKEILGSVTGQDSQIVVESAQFTSGVDQFGLHVDRFVGAAFGGLAGGPGAGIGGPGFVPGRLTGPGAAPLRSFTFDEPGGALLKSGDTYDRAANLSLDAGVAQVEAGYSMAFSASQFSVGAGSILSAASLFASGASPAAGAALGVLSGILSIVAAGGGFAGAAHGAEVTKSGLVGVHAGETIYAAGAPGSRTGGGSSGVTVNQTIVYENGRPKSQSVNAEGGSEEDRQFFHSSVLLIMEDELRPGGRLYRES